MNLPEGVFAFGPFRLDTTRRVLWREGELVPLPPRALDVLVALVERHGEVVTKQELLDRVWPETFVEEANLSVNVSALRKALGKPEDGRDYIQTVSRRGYRFRPLAGPRVAARRTLAVLPFRSLSPAGTDAHLGLGLCDALITALGAVPELSVRPTSLVEKYAATGVDAEAAARELKVDLVLDGRFQRQDGRLRLTAQLVDPVKRRAAWTGAAEAPDADLFHAQDALASRVLDGVAGALRLHRPSHQAPADAAPSPAAYEAFLKGRFFWNKLTVPWLKKALAEFEEAVRLDPGYASAHAGAADARTMLTLLGEMPKDEGWKGARAAAERAVALAPQRPEAHVSLSYARLFQDWDWAGAGEGLKRAVALAPLSAEARQWHALYLAMTGRFEDALAEVEEARRLDPLSLTVRTNAGFQVYLAQQVQPDVEQQRRTLELEPDWAIGHWALGLALQQKEEYEEAVAAHQRAVDLSGGNVLLRAALGRSLALAGRRGEALALLDELRRLPEAPGYPRPGGSPAGVLQGDEAHPVLANAPGYHLATLLLALGDTEGALAELERSCAQHDHWMVWLAVDPMLGPLHDDPRFARLRERVGLPPS